MFILSRIILLHRNDLSTILQPAMSPPKKSSTVYGTALSICIYLSCNEPVLTMQLSTKRT